MILFDKPKQICHLVLSDRDPVPNSHQDYVLSDIIWINYVTGSLYILDNEFVAVTITMFEFFKCIPYLHHKKYIIITDVDYIFTHESEVSQSFKYSGSVMKVTAGWRGCMLKNNPIGIISTNRSGLMLILFQLLIRLPPRNAEQLFANFINAQNTCVAILDQP
jgi:hypothetical protein